MSTVDGVEVTGPMEPRPDEVLTPQALGLVALLDREPDGRRLERLQARTERVRALADGGIDEETAAIAEVEADASASGRWDDARAFSTGTALADEYEDLLTVPAYERMP